MTVNGPKTGRGIYLREVGETLVSRDFKVTVEPKFHEDALSSDKVSRSSSSSSSSQCVIKVAVDSQTNTIV